MIINNLHLKFKGLEPIQAVLQWLHSLKIWHASSLHKLGMRCLCGCVNPGLIVAMCRLGDPVSFYVHELSKP